jgi:hypothetical protein
MSMSELSKPLIRYLTEIDHHDHEAMIALDEQTGAGIGVACYVRDSNLPEVAAVRSPRSTTGAVGASG